MKWSLTHMASSSVSSVQVLAGCSGVPLWSMQAAGEQKTKQGRKLRLRYGSTRVYPSKRLQTNIHTEIKGPLVALDKAKDFVVEVEAGVPDEGPVAEDPQHHPAACCVSDSPAETEAETESNSQSQSEPWCYPQDENLPKMNPKHQNDPMLAPACRAPSKSDRHTTLRSGGIPIRPHQKNPHCSNHLDEEKPEVLRGRQERRADGQPGGRAGGRKDLGFLCSPLPVPSRAPASHGSALLPHQPSSPTCLTGDSEKRKREEEPVGAGPPLYPARRQHTHTDTARGLSRSRRSERGDDPDEDQDGGRRTVWPVAGGHRHVMPPACVAATPLLPRPAVFHGISQENEALVFSRGGART